MKVWLNIGSQQQQQQYLCVYAEQYTELLPDLASGADFDLWPLSDLSTNKKTNRSLCESIIVPI